MVRGTEYIHKGVNAMKAIILAAGRGSRMKEKTNVLPKCLTTLWGRTLLEWQLKAIKEAGIEEIGIITGYRAEEIRKRQPDLSYFHNERWAETNMVATLMEAESWLEADDCIVSYSDILYSSRGVSALFQAKADISLTYYTKFLPLWEKRFENPLEDIESFKLDEKSFLKEIGQKASSLAEIEGQYMGVLRFSRKGWQDVKKRLEGNLPRPIQKIDMTGLLDYLISSGMRIQAIPYDGLWLEVDNPKDLSIYESWEAEGLQQIEK